MFFRKAQRIFPLIAFVLLCTNASSAIRLPHIFSDNMVIQRDVPVTIWGWSSEDSPIKVSLGNDSVLANPDSEGKWKAVLPARKAGGDFVISIDNGSECIRLENVTAGDIWLCSGQSNMEFTVGQAANSKAEIAMGNNPMLRLLNVPQAISTSPQEDIRPSAWTECTEETVGSFSAVGYYFGRETASELGVPIGLINASWGGTDIRAWTSWDTLTEELDLKEYRNSDAQSYHDDIRRSEREFWNAVNEDRAIHEGWYREDYDISGWETVELPYSVGNIFDNEDGIVWYSLEFTVPDNLAGLPAVLKMGAVDDEDTTYINGVWIGGINGWDTARRHEIPAGLLHTGKNRLTFRCKDTNGGGGPRGKTEDYRIEIGGKRINLAGEWKYKASALSSMFNCRIISDHNIPSVLYNAMIHPYIQFPIKGVIWYQGESNTAEAHYYRTLFPAMIRDWRRLWGKEFPFIWVQLANYREMKPYPEESDWAELREAQSMTLSLPATGQAVITDIGEAGDIHPRNKQDVGYRLSRAALKTAYGHNIIGEGPVLEKAEIKEDRIILRFRNCGSGLRTVRGSRNVRGFAIAGEDRHFVWAEAKIIGKDKIEVSSSAVSNPVALRYAWADNPGYADLINSESLLASPFRTDIWPGITE